MKSEIRVKSNCFKLTVVLCAAVSGVFGATGDLLGNIGDVQLKGYLGKRLDAMIANHVAGQDVDYITAVFQEKTERRRWWQTEFWGKWIISACRAARYEHDDEMVEFIRRGCYALIETADEDGASEEAVAGVAD